MKTPSSAKVSIFCLALALSATPLAAQEATQDAVRGDITISGGGMNVDNGYSDRTFAGLLANVYLQNGLGLHLDVSGHWREEDAGFFSGGLSYEVAPGIRPKVMVGSSTSNDYILPKLLVQGAVEMNFGPQTGIIFTPRVTYRDYRSGIDEVAVSASLVKYFAPFANGSYLVGQVEPRVVFVSPGSNTGYELSAALTWAFPRSHSLALEVFGGRMAYDAVLTSPGTSVRNDFIGVRPKVSFHLDDNIELFIKGEYVDTDYYNAIGAFGGLKLSF